MAKKANNTDSNAPKDDFVEGVENSKGASSAPKSEASAEAASAPMDDSSAFGSGSGDSAAPVDNPPFASQDPNDGGFGAAVWHDNKKITALWSKNETRNSWAAVSGLGWKRLNSSNDSSCTALTILAAHARNYNRNVKLKLDNDQIKEIYVW